VELLVGDGVCGLVGIPHGVVEGAGVGVGVGVGVGGGAPVVKFQTGPLLLQVELKATICQ